MTTNNFCLCLGDSITQLSWGDQTDGWMSLLQNHYDGKSADRPLINFINRGFSGYSSEHAVRHVLPNLKESIRIYDQKISGNAHQASNIIKFATIFYGANDSVLKSCEDNSQHVPLDNYRNNLITILDHFNQNFPNLQKVILITLPKYDYNNWKVITRKKYSLEFYPESKRSNENAEEYAKVVIDLISNKTNNKYGFEVETANLFGAMQKIENFEDYLCDGLHLNSNGNRLLFEL